MRALPSGLAFALVVLQAAHAQNIAAGERIAKRWCSACHLTGPQGAASDAAPSFYAIADAPSTTAASLAYFLSRRHPPMPDFALTRIETADVSAYILSLRKPR